MPSSSTSTLMMLACFIGVAGGCSDSSTPAEPDPAPDPVRYQDVVFQETTATTALSFGASVPFGEAQAVPLLLDMYGPEGDTETARAAIVWIHGGGFVTGRRSAGSLVDLARSFAARGYVSVSIDYRLRTKAERTADPEGTIRDAVHDARAAVRWLRANADAYGIDPDRIAIGGSSAGAITSLFAAYDDAWGEGSSGNPGHSSQVRAVVDLWGSLAGDREAQMDAGEPPLIIIHGTEDTTVPYADAQKLVTRASAVGVPFELYPLEGEGHAPWSLVPPLEGDIAAFLYEQVIR